MAYFKPIDIDKQTWCYVEDEGFRVIHQVTNNAGAFVTTADVLVPWEAVRFALAKQDKRKAPRKRAVSKDGARKASGSVSLPAARKIKK